jgi:aspartate racemase
VKRVGIIGGLGPAATVDFFRRLVAATPVTIDQEHIPVIIDSDPRCPDRNQAVAGTGPSPGPALAASARRLQAAGADVIVMACNTAHAWQSEIEAAIDLPFLSIIDATVAATSGDGPVGLLAGRGCVHAGLFQQAFAPREVLIGDLARFMALLYRIKAGDTGSTTRAAMRAEAEALVERGATALIAGCTEVPLVLAPEDVAVPLISSTDALVAQTIAFART